MEIKHTKGKWKVYEPFNAPLKSEDGLSEHLSHWILNEQNVFIADVGYNTVKNEGLPLVDKVDEMKANAKLIAAAPELLEACNYFIELFQESDMRPEDECNELYYKIKEAINKATK